MTRSVVIRCHKHGKNYSTDTGEEGKKGKIRASNLDLDLDLSFFTCVSRVILTTPSPGELRLPDNVIHMHAAQTAGLSSSCTLYVTSHLIFVSVFRSLLFSHLLLPWLEDLPRLLVELGTSSPELSTLIIDSLASAAPHMSLAQLGDSIIGTRMSVQHC